MKTGQSLPRLPSVSGLRSFGFSKNRRRSRMGTNCLLAVVCTLSILGARTASGVTIDTILVGNPGNPPDQNYGPGQFGAAAEPYQIGTYEVTNDQYAQFLNAVAATDTHGLYNVGSSQKPIGVVRSGASGSFAYSVAANMGNKPFNWASFWDAARFCNWLTNGQPTGLQGPGTTEGGAYSLNGISNPVNDMIFRNPGAKWFLPTEDQWYKAAYHQPATQGGDSDDYWLYPTTSNVVPVIASANAVGDISNPGTNVANYAEGADWNGRNGNLTTVGSAGNLSKSFYGTFDQAGNVWEWNETIINSSSRGLRGYSWDNSDPNYLSAAGRINGFNPASGGANGNIGFRVATIPEPRTFILVALPTIFMLIHRGKAPYRVGGGDC